MRQRILLIGLLISAAGCGDNVAPVSGRVTLDKKPLANATVIFSPDSDQFNPGPGSQGRTDANGEFTLNLMTKEVKGAIIGKHKVSITAYEGNDRKAPSSGSDMVFAKGLVPPRYNSMTELTFMVPPGGSTGANFDLQSEPPAPK